MAKKPTIKTCYFQIETPQRPSGIRGDYFQKTNTLLESPNHCIAYTPSEVAEMPRIKFQAELTFSFMGAKRIEMNDRFGHPWSVYASDINVMVPRMVHGRINAWWSIVKKGDMYGVKVDVDTPLMAQVPVDQDVPLMLSQIQDIRTLLPEFTAMAV